MCFNIYFRAYRFKDKKSDKIKIKLSINRETCLYLFTGKGTFISPR